MPHNKTLTTYHILLSIVRTFYVESDAEIFPAHYTWKVTEKAFKIDFMMNKLAMINSCKSFLEKLKKNIFFKNHCEIQVRTVLECTLYSIKYGSITLLL